MGIMDANFIQGFVRMAHDGWEQGWHEKNGGNLSYRMTDENVNLIRHYLHTDGAWIDIGTTVPDLAGEFFLVTGSGKFFRNVKAEPDDNICILQVDESGSKYQVQWGLVNGGRPTSELPSHLMNHEVKKRVSNGAIRVIYHAHPANIIALTFILPLEDEVFTRDLWEMASECSVVFPGGVGVIPWMVPGGADIAMATSELMKTYQAAIWAQHGLFASGPDFDITFGLAHTIEKSAEIYWKVLATGQPIRQTITDDALRAIAKDFGVQLNEAFLD